MYFIIVHLVAAIVLLLWAVRMVRTAVERAYSAQLKRTLAHAERSAFSAATVGVGMAVALQSSTAVAALASSFASGGLLAGSTGLALMLGAYFGSALVASVLSFDLTLLTAPLIIVGGALFLRANERQMKQLGRMILGIAFVLLSLEMVSEATAPWRESDVLLMGIDYLRGDPWTGFIIAALVTWFSYSSVASVLVIITFGASGVIPFEVAAALVLGANLGGTLIALGMTRGADVRARRIAIGALLFRGGAAVLALAIIEIFQVHSMGLPGDVGLQASLFHSGFNLLVMILGLPMVGPASRLLDRFVQAGASEESTDLARLRRPALTASSHGNVDADLASATRELLRMSELVEVMLQPTMEILKGGDKAAIRRVKALEPEVDRANAEIKLFLSQLDWDNMDEGQTSRASDLSTFAISLEQAGDIISRQLLRVADQLNDRHLTFSAQGWEELLDLHTRVLGNLQLALNVLVSEDIESARHLVAEKDEVGILERNSVSRHFARLRTGDPNSFETSELHLQTLRSLRHINSLLCSVAYSILSEQGELLGSKLASRSAR
ncbi:Na/Pi cotransporter family protein [Devosia sp. BK]|uniref:Na/Pi cotransporter family protein n=1 Tax=Devosia sp. BK TaxID=2871706 RepID=UPI00293B7A2D|nr:Na/Pi cotransporter family protein [Devosia sp. BK]MDV3249759.1 Na/Pi cotransporter family protein [Devosia sp. BK]